MVLPDPAKCCVMEPVTMAFMVAVVAEAIDNMPPFGKSTVIVAGMVKLTVEDAVPVGHINLIGFVSPVNTSLAIVCAPWRLEQSTIPPVDGRRAAAAVNFAPKFAPVVQYCLLLIDVKLTRPAANS